MSFDVMTVARAVRSAASTYLASAGGITIGEVPGDRALPYAVLTVVDSVPWRQFDRDGFRMRVQITTFGAIDTGPAAVAASAATLRGLLSRARITASGVEAMVVDYDIERPPFREADRWRQDQDFIIHGREST